MLYFDSRQSPHVTLIRQWPNAVFHLARKIQKRLSDQKKKKNRLDWLRGSVMDLKKHVIFFKIDVKYMGRDTPKPVVIELGDFSKKHVRI